MSQMLRKLVHAGDFGHVSNIFETGPWFSFAGLSNVIVLNDLACYNATDKHVTLDVHGGTDVLVSPCLKRQSITEKLQFHSIHWPSRKPMLGLRPK